MSSINQMSQMFNAKFLWTDNITQALYSSLLGASGCSGMAIGAVTAGYLLSLGRKNSFLISSLFCIVGCSITLVENITAILIGRVIWGYGVGVLSVNISRFIEETVPAFLLSLFGPIFPWA